MKYLLLLLLFSGFSIVGHAELNEGQRQALIEEKENLALQLEVQKIKTELGKLKAQAESDVSDSVNVEKPMSRIKDNAVLSDPKDNSNTGQFKLENVLLLGVSGPEKNLQADVLINNVRVKLSKNEAFGNYRLTAIDAYCISLKSGNDNNKYCLSGQTKETFEKGDKINSSSGVSQQIQPEGSILGLKQPIIYKP